jgi:hypothetical protein
MKTKISILLVLFALALNAQVWNKTYNINGNDEELHPSFIIGTEDLGSVSVSWAIDNPNSPSVDYFILTKHDSHGFVIYNNRIYPANPQKDGFTHVKALIETKDNGVMVAGYYYKSLDSPMQPFLLKVDKNGVLQWVRWYYVNYNQYKGFQFNKISLARVENDDKENYFIVSCAASDLQKGDNVVNVIKVNDVGGMIWSKKYFDTNNPDYTTWDVPGDIAFSKGDKMYMITGTRSEFKDGQDDKMFFFGIDRDGNVMTYFKVVSYPERHFVDQDMIFDPNTKYFAVAYTSNNDNDFPYSKIGLITIDASLNINLFRFYWDSEAKVNNGLSISLSVNKDYVIGSDLYDGFLGRHNPSLLKVDNNGSPINMWRYNTDDNAYFAHHCNSFNICSNEEEYVWIGEHKTNLRAARTTIDFKNECGNEYKPVEEKTDYKEELRKHEPKNIGEPVKYKVYSKELNPEVEICQEAGCCRPAGAAAASLANTNGSGVENIIFMYPTQTSASQPILLMENSSKETLNLKVQDITGKLVYSNTLATGKNTINLGANGNLSEGVYLVKFQNADGSISGTRKLMLTK